MTKASESKIIVSLFFFVFSIYLLSSGGHIYTKDGFMMAKVAESILQFGDFAVRGVSPEALSYGVDGNLYAPTGLGQSLMCIPFTLLGQWMFDVSGLEWVKEYCLVLLNVFVSSFLCIVFYLYARLLSIQPKTSLITTLFFGVGTMVWPYSKFFFSEPLSGLFFLLSLYFMTQAVRDLKSPKFLLSGFFAGLMMLTRVNMVFFVPMMLIYLVWGLTSNQKCGVVSGVKKGVLFIAAFIPSLAVFAWVNLIRFGAWYKTGYHNANIVFENVDWGFTTPFYVGLWGLLFSPGKSIFLYVPLACLFIPAMKSFRKQNPIEAVVFLILILQILIGTSLWINWGGGISWGPRFLYPVIALLMLPIASLLQNEPKWRKWALGLFAAGVAVNLLGVLVNFTEYTILFYSEYDYGAYNNVLFHPGYSPILTHLKLLWVKFTMFVNPDGTQYEVIKTLDLGWLSHFKDAKIGFSLLLAISITMLITSGAYISKKIVGK